MFGVGMPCEPNELIWASFHATPIDLCIKFKSISCIMSCLNKFLSNLDMLSASMATYMFFSLIKIIRSFNFGNGNIEFWGRYKYYHNYFEQRM